MTDVAAGAPPPPPPPPPSNNNNRDGRNHIRERNRGNSEARRREMEEFVEMRQEQERSEERREMVEDLVERASNLNPDDFPAPNPSYNFERIREAERHMWAILEDEDEDNRMHHHVEFELLVADEHGVLVNEGIEEPPDDLINYGMCEGCEKWGPLHESCPFCGLESGKEFEHVSYYAED